MVGCLEKEKESLQRWGGKLHTHTSGSRRPANVDKKYCFQDDRFAGNTVGKFLKMLIKLKERIFVKGKLRKLYQHLIMNATTNSGLKVVFPAPSIYWKHDWKVAEC